MSHSSPGQIITPRKTLRHHKIPPDLQRQAICDGFSFALDKLYPGYLWQVGMQQDVVFIQNMSLNTKKAFSLPLASFDINGKVLMRVGGEILERFKMQRGKRNQADFKSLIRDVSRNAKPDMG